VLDDEGQESSQQPPGKSLHSGGALVSGHAGASIAAITASSSTPEFATIGTDGCVRIYSIESHQMARMHVISQAAPLEAGAYAPDGTNLAVAYAGGVDVLDPLNMAEAITRLALAPAAAGDGAEGDAKDGAPPRVTFLRYSPDGGLIIACDETHEVKAFTTGGDWGQKLAFSVADKLAEGARVVGIDVSEDNAWIRVTSDALDVLHVSMESAEVYDDPAAFKASGSQFSAPSSGPVSFEKQCAYPAHCAAKMVSASVVSGAGNLTAVGDVYGDVHLFHYPATKPTGAATWRAHTLGAVLAAFTMEDSHLVTAGKQDLCAVQWGLQMDEQVDEPKEPEPDAEADEDEEEGEKEVIIQDPEDPPSEDMAPVSLSDDAERLALARALVSMDTSVINRLSAEPSPGATPDMTSNATAATTSLPQDSLKLDWVHGASVQGTRHPVHYNKVGEAVYPAGALLVAFDKTARTQRHLHAHTASSVSAVAMHPDKAHVASGSRLPFAQVSVSNTLSGQVLQVFPAPEGSTQVTSLAFSPDGSLLAFVVEDPARTLTVYRWQDGELVAQVPTNGGRVLDLAFSPDARQLLSVGVDHFDLWRLHDRTLSRQRGLFGASAVKQTLLCAAWVPAASEEAEAFAIMGAADGSLYKLEGRTVSDVSEKLHTGGLAAIDTYKPFEEDGHCIVTGGRDGMLKFLGPDLEPKIEVSLRDRNRCEAFRWAVRGVNMYKDGRKVLVATAGSELFEISATEDGVDLNNGPLVSGHARLSCTGLAAHPIQQEYATVGQDRTLRLWDLENRQLSRKIELPGEALSVAYRPDGHLIAVGLGGAHAGTVCFVSTLKQILEVVKEVKDTSHAITRVRFSPDGRTLAAASEAGGLSEVLLYDCLNTKEPGGAFVLRARFELAELSRSEAAGGDSGAAQEESKDDASTNTLTNKATGEVDVAAIEAHYQSMADAAKQYDDVELVYQPPSPPQMDFTADSQSIQYATGRGLVYLSAESGEAITGEAAASLGSTAEWDTWTCTSGPPVAGFTASSVQGCEWTGTARAGDKSMVASVDDFGCVALFAWPCTARAPPFRLYRAHAGPIAEAAFSVNDAFLLTQGGTDRCTLQWSRQRSAGTERDRVSGEEMHHGVQSGSAAAVNTSGKRLAHVYGFSPVRNSVAYDREFSAVYPAGGVGIVYSKHRHEQRQMTSHMPSMIRAMRVAPNGCHVASSDACGKVVVWDSKNARSLSEVQLPDKSEVDVLAFSTDSKRLLACAADQHHTIYVLESPSGTWRDASVVASAYSGSHTILCATWTTVDKPGASCFATGGSGALQFWALDGKNLRSEYVDTSSRNLTVTALLDLAPFTVAGTASGELIVWDGTKVFVQKPAHTGRVTTLCANEAESARFVSAGEDGNLMLWEKSDEDLNLVSDWQASPENGSSAISSVAADSAFTKLLVSSASGHLKEVVWDSKAAVTVVRTHSNGQISSTSAHHACGDLFATGGVDGTVFLWSSAKKALVAVLHLNRPIKSLAWGAASEDLYALVGAPNAIFQLSANSQGASIEVAREVAADISEGDGIKVSEDGKVIQVGEVCYDAESGSEVPAESFASAPESQLDPTCVEGAGCAYTYQAAS